MVNRAAVLLLGAVSFACETERRDFSGAHVLASLPNADFAFLGLVESFSGCAGVGRCNAADQPAGVMMLAPETAFFGVMSGRYATIGTVVPEAVSWWSRGAPVRLLFIGRNGSPTGWTAPRAHPPGDPSSTQQIEPVCGLTTSESVAVPDFATYIYDEVHRTYIDAVYLGSMHEHYSATGVDYEGNPVPESIGSREVRKAIEDGWVIEQERADGDLRQAGQQQVERKANDDTFNTGTCVLAE